MLVDDFIDFLGSFKNAESVTPELQEVIAIPTGLEEIVLAALGTAPMVLITGSAGSGKTHLVRGVLDRLTRTAEVVGPGQHPRKPYVLVVPDATELTVEERVQLVVETPKHRSGALVAINEGPLLEAARWPNGEMYFRAVEYLRKAQRGVLEPFDSATPTVVNLGPFDPLDEGAVAKLLALDLLVEVVDRSPCACDTEDCPRRRAWRQLKVDAVRRRVADIIKLVRLVDSDWLFRDLWDFVADLAMGGSCDDSPPSSAWFWRLFYGESRMAHSLREIAEPSTVPLPGVDSRLFASNWDSNLLSFEPGVDFIPLSQSKESLAPFWWVKAQVLMTLVGLNVTRRTLGRPGGYLRKQAYEGNVPGIVQAINTYFAYGLRDGSEGILDLWVEHAVERRTQHVQAVIRMGSAESTAFEIRRSQVVANHPKNVAIAGGLDHFLMHTPSNAAFLLDQSRLRLLQRGRSVRAADRLQADLDWDLCEFFDQILSASEPQKEFSIVFCDLADMRSSVSQYRVLTTPIAIEEV